MKNKILIKYTIIIFVVAGLCACKKFLDATPDKTLVVPQSLDDLQKLIDYDGMNAGFPVAPEITSDNYYVTDASWKSISDIDQRNLYIWSDSNTVEQDWLGCYQRISTANIVLDQLNIMGYETSTKNQWNILKGEALFHRAYNFYFLSQIYSPPYTAENKDRQWGIPLKLSSDINEPTKRSTISDTYRQMTSDLYQCISLLDDTTVYKNRPSRAAVYGLLARIYLAMQQYDSCLLYANNCLAIQPGLMDYNSFDTLASIPFARFNKEVIFSSTPQSSLITNPALYSKVDSLLFRQYAGNDLRKALFYKKNTDGSYKFKGSYGGSSTALYNGISVDEIYLDRAECNARLGNPQKALDDLNTLLVTRWKKGTFMPYNTSSADTALNIILSERRKELAFRSGLRWFDLRRLNLDQATSVTLTRGLNGTSYILLPNDKGYIFLIPQDVINLSGIQQNQR